MTEILQSDEGSHEFSTFFNHIRKKLSSLCHKKKPRQIEPGGAFYFEKSELI